MRAAIGDASRAHDFMLQLHASYSTDPKQTALPSATHLRQLNIAPKFCIYERTFLKPAR